LLQHLLGVWIPYRQGVDRHFGFVALDREGQEMALARLSLAARLLPEPQPCPWSAGAQIGPPSRPLLERDRGGARTRPRPHRLDGARGAVPVLQRLTVDFEQEPLRAGIQVVGGHAEPELR